MRRSRFRQAGRRWQRIRKYERLLTETGAIEFLEDGPLDAWMEEYLDMEAGGWKGRQGVAAKSQAGTEAFFRSIGLLDAFREGGSHSFDDDHLEAVEERHAAVPLIRALRKISESSAWLQ